MIGSTVMGPTCEVLLENEDGAVFETLDMVLSSMADRIVRTGKGRVWDIWVRGRSVHVHLASSPPIVQLSAGCNSPEDYAVLRHVTRGIVEAIGGKASEPEK